MDVPTPTDQRRPDSVTLAVLVSEMRSLKTTVERIGTKVEECRESQGRVETQLAVGAERMQALATKDDEIDKHLEATDARIVAVEGDKRGIAGVLTSIGAAAAAVYSIFKG